MPSTPTSREDAIRAARMLMAMLPPTDAEPEYFWAGVADLLQTYPLEVVRRAQSPVSGLPSMSFGPQGKSSFCPRIAEMKTALDGWAREEREHQRRQEQWSRPALPAPRAEPKPKAMALRSSLIQYYGIPDVPAGMSAVDLCQKRHELGDKFVEYINSRLAAGGPTSLFGKVVERVRKAKELGADEDGVIPAAAE